MHNKRDLAPFLPNVELHEVPQNAQKKHIYVSKINHISPAWPFPPLFLHIQQSPFLTRARVHTYIAQLKPWPCEINM